MNYHKMTGEKNIPKHIVVKFENTRNKRDDPKSDWEIEQHQNSQV